MKIHSANERGHTKIDWLDSRHSFSFGEFQDPMRNGFRSLLVINEDKVTAGSGFQTHGHKDMEILTYVLSGELAHKDSLGTGSVIRPGQVQIMSAGTGIHHSEFNNSQSQSVHFLQIWMLPNKKNITPRYDQREFSRSALSNTLKLVGSPNGIHGSVLINQDILLYACELNPESNVSFEVKSGRYAWIQMISGNVTLNGKSAFAGDGIQFDAAGQLTISANSQSEFLLFDLA